MHMYVQKPYQGQFKAQGPCDSYTVIRLSCNHWLEKPQDHASSEHWDCEEKQRCHNH